MRLSRLTRKLTEHCMVRGEIGASACNFLPRGGAQMAYPDHSEAHGNGQQSLDWSPSEQDKKDTLNALHAFLDGERDRPGIKMKIELG